MIRSAWFLSFVPLLSACATVDHSPRQSGISWDADCYDGFSEHVAALSGTNAVDCGFFDLKSSSQEKERVRTCARKAVSSSAAFKFGHASFGYDSDFCTVAVRDNAGAYWWLFFDADVSGHAADQPWPVLRISKCSGLHFTRGERDLFFQFENCEERQDVSRRLLESAR